MYVRMCMHMYPCMYVVYVYVYIYMCMHVCVCMCTCICVYVYVYIQSICIFAESLHAFTGVLAHHACAGVYVRQML